MKRTALAALGGFLLAMGLGLAGLTNPSRILGFLDFAGRWDPTALLVLLAAAGTYAVGHRAYMRSLERDGLRLPRAARTIDRRLALGATIFGVGWGLSGLCPAPAVVAASSGAPPVLVFTASMLAGMWLHAAWARQGRAS